MQSNKLEIQQLSQNYGKKIALQSVSLHIENGLHGLLGRNGAGKTTLMKTIVGLLPPKSGDIRLCGVPVSNLKRVRAMVGYLPQEFSLYPGMRVEEALDYLGILSNIPQPQRKKRIELLLQRVNLIKQRGDKIKSLSGGMKRRLGVAQALLHQPRIVVADEPTVGLDPEERVRLRELLMEEAKDKIVILSTHIVEDIEAACQRVTVLDEGKLLYTGGVLQLMEETATTSMESAYLKMIHSPKEVHV